MVGCRQGILATIAFSSFIRSRWINLTGAQFQFEHANDNEAMRHAALALELLFNHRWLCRRTRRRRRREAGRARKEGGRGHGKFQICHRRRDATPSITPEAVVLEDGLIHCRLVRQD